MKISRVFPVAMLGIGALGLSSCASTISQSVQAYYQTQSQGNIREPGYEQEPQCESLPESVVSRSIFRPGEPTLAIPTPEGWEETKAQEVEDRRLAFYLPNDFGETEYMTEVYGTAVDRSQSAEDVFARFEEFLRENAYGESVQRYDMSTTCGFPSVRMDYVSLSDYGDVDSRVLYMYIPYGVKSYVFEVNMQTIAEPSQSFDLLVEKTFAGVQLL